MRSLANKVALELRESGGNVKELDMAEASFVDYAKLLRDGMDYPECAIPYFQHPAINLSKSDQRTAFARTLEDEGVEVLVIDSARALRVS